MKVRQVRAQGFTIVELLIVIVVIAILAAIMIVAYNGVQDRGKTTSAHSLANSVSKKAEIWHAVVDSYPTYCQLVTNTIDATGTGTGLGVVGCTPGATKGPSEARLDDQSAVSATPTTAANGSSVVQYESSGSGCARIHFWIFSAHSISTPTSEPHSVLVGSGC